jgi:hypothetical protein
VDGLGVRTAVARVARLLPIAGSGQFYSSSYLIHIPLQQVPWQQIVFTMMLRPVQTFSIMATPGIASIVVLPHLFYLVFEHPFCGTIGGWGAFLSSNPQCSTAKIAARPC